MKQNTFFLSVLVLCCLNFFWSCDDETGKNLLKLDKDNIMLNHKDAHETVTLTAGTAWQVSDVPDWMEVTPSTSDQLKQKITITADENNTFEQRTATLTFTNGHISRALSITQLSLQEADAFIQFSESEIMVSLILTHNVKLITNRPWKIDGIPAWMSVSPSSGEKSATLSITVDENYHPDSRNAEILFTAEKAQNTLKVSQIGLKDIIRGVSLPIFRFKEIKTNSSTDGGGINDCQVKNNYMFVNPAIKDKVFLGNLLSHNVGEGTDIPAFTGYTFKPITIMSTAPVNVYSKTYTPSLAEQTNYAKKVADAKPQQMGDFVSDNGTIDFYSYRLLHAIGVVNFGVKLDELVTGHSYADHEMQGKYGLIFSFRQTLFSLIMDLPDDGTVINEKLKDADKNKGVSYVSSMSYGKIGLLVVETGIDSRKVRTAINKYIGEQTLDAEETALITSSAVTYVYFDNNNQVKTIRGGINAVEAYRKAATTVDYENIYPLTFQLSNFDTHAQSEISYAVKIP